MVLHQIPQLAAHAHRFLPDDPGVYRISGSPGVRGLDTLPRFSGIIIAWLVPGIDENSQLGQAQRIGLRDRKRRACDAPSNGSSPIPE